MSDTLVIEIVDSHNEPRCSILWECGEMCKYSAYLAYAIGSLNDDSTTEEIIENIREVFPGIGIPREGECYVRSDLGMAEDALATQYADDLGLPDGNAYEGLLAVSQCSMDKFDSWANSLNWLYLGNVTMKDCIVDEEDLEEYCCLYNNAKAEIESIKKSAFHIEDKSFDRRITTKEEGNELLRIINNYEWVEYEGSYYKVK